MNLDALRTFATQRFVRAVAANPSGLPHESQVLANDLAMLRNEATKASIRTPAGLALEPTTKTPYNPGRVLLDARTAF